jgi:hypothetical protein
MISLRQYYYIALWLPLIVPFLMWGLTYNIHDKDFFIRTPFFLFFSAVKYSWLQYVVFASWTMYKYKKALTRELKKFSLEAPIAFIPYFAIGFLLQDMVLHLHIPSIDSLFFTLILSLVCLPFGYFYVALSYSLQWVLEKTGFIKRELI